MARVTVEDCIDKVENRFELVLLASHRARQISQGAQIAVDRDNDKNPVVALREIADEMLAPDDLKEDLIHSLQKHVEVDEPEADGQDLIDQADATTTAPDGTCAPLPTATIRPLETTTVASSMLPAGPDVHTVACVNATASGCAGSRVARPHSPSG